MPSPLAELSLFRGGADLAQSTGTSREVSAWEFSRWTVLVEKPAARPCYRMPARGCLRPLRPRASRPFRGEGAHLARERLGAMWREDSETIARSAVYVLEPRSRFAVAERLRENLFLLLMHKY